MCSLPGQRRRVSWALLMIGVKVGAVSGRLPRRVPVPPPGLGWTGPSLALVPQGGGWRTGFNPRGLVDPAIWTGAAIHVDGVSGSDSNSGLGVPDGTFGQAKKTLHAAFAAGNATGAPYRVIVKSGQFAGSAFTNNGAVEPNRACALIGWDGPVRYRAGNWTQTWLLDQGTTHTATVTSVMRVFPDGPAHPGGLYTELAWPPIWPRAARPWERGSRRRETCFTSISARSRHVRYRADPRLSRGAVPHPCGGLVP